MLIFSFSSFPFPFPLLLSLSLSLSIYSQTEGIKEYDPESPERDALNFEDLCTYALARFSDVDDFRKALNDTQLVTPRKLYNKWARVMSQGKSDSVPWHFSVTDKTGKGVIVQIRNGTTEVVVRKRKRKNEVFLSKLFLKFSLPPFISLSLSLFLYFFPFDLFFFLSFFLSFLSFFLFFLSF